MLATTRSMTFLPGSNLKGQVAGANWLFLLPSMELGQVVCFGRPSARSLATLSRMSREVLVLDDQPGPETAGEEPTVRHVEWKPGSVLKDLLPVVNQAADAVVITGGDLVRRFHSDAALRTELAGLLKADGWVYIEQDGLLDRLSGAKAAARLAESLGCVRAYWSTPLEGELHAAVPLEDEATRGFFVRTGLYQPDGRLRVLKKARKVVMDRLVANRLVQRSSLLITPGGVSPAGPPRYITEIARQAGIDLTGYRWGMAAHGEYSTRKVLFFLFQKDAQSPEYIVKMVRDPAYNARLENEYRALTTLWEKGLGERGFLPRPLFFGHENRLAVFGESAVEGSDFRKRTTFRPDCPLANTAADHLTALAAATVDPHGAAPGQVVEVLLSLFQRLVEIYQPDTDARAFLEQQIQAIGRLPGSVPLVFQHGDPGTWNMLADASDGVKILDWEAAEDKGLPLWDLFYYLRAYISGAARKAGTRSAIQGFADLVLREGDFNRFITSKVDRYVERIGLPGALVEPLFYTCWMHRALKEANRLPPGKLQKGHYYNLLLFTIRQRHNPEMKRLLSSSR